MTNLVPRRAELSPWRLFDEDLDNIFEGFFRPLRPFERTSQGALIPAVDISENDEQYVVRAELPGVKKEDISVTVEGGVLRISGESKSEHEEKENGRVIRQERHYGQYVLTAGRNAGSQFQVRCKDRPGRTGKRSGIPNRFLLHGLR